MLRGRAVVIKRGKGSGKIMVVLKCENKYVYLTDGKSRKLANPKKKSVKHIQLTNYNVNLEIGGRELQDADIRKGISTFTPKGGNEHCLKTMS